MGVVSDHQIFVVGASTAGKASQAGGEIPLSLEIGVSKNIPHNSLEHFEKLS